MILHPENIIMYSAEFGSDYLKTNKIMAPGHNGPYQDQETPIRNNAHWAMIFIKAFELSKKEKYLVHSKNCIEYIKSKITPDNPVYICRHKKGKDKTNGLIGQAWAIQPLVEIQKFEIDKNAIDVSISVIKKHYFSSHKNLWKTCDENGNPTIFDNTFNHQLWFASVSSSLAEHDTEIDYNVQTFMNNIERILHLRRNGRIGQAIFSNSFDSSIKPFIKKIIKPKDINYMLLKEVGYHAFNTIAFINLHRNYPKHKFWESKSFKKILRYFDSTEYQTQIYNSIYGFAYNPPSYEVLATDNYFANIHKVNPLFISELWDHQIKLSWDGNQRLMSEGSYDRNTHIARSYECLI